MKRLFVLFAAMLAALAMTGAARAQMVTAQNPSSVVSAIQRAGYQAALQNSDSGSPYIDSASSGSSFTIFFYGCTGGKDCKTVQFFSGYKSPRNASLNALNEWNAKNRFGRAYVSDSGSVRLEMDVDLDDGGMSTALFQDNLEFWVVIMASFEKHIGWTN